MCERDETNAQCVALAKATPGGHLFVHENGYTLYYNNVRFYGYVWQEILPLAIQAGLPVIDSRPVEFKARANLKLGGPHVAVNQAPSAEPFNCLSFAPLEHVAKAYQDAGATIYNLAI